MSRKFHKMGEIVANDVSTTLSLDSDSDSEKENSFWDVKCKYAEAKKVADSKRPKLISKLEPRDYVALCKTALAEFNKRRQECGALSEFERDSPQTFAEGMGNSCCKRQV